MDMKPKTMMDMALLPNFDPMDIGLGSSEKGNVVPTAKPRKKTTTSVYLKCFETAPDGKSRRCKFCGQSYSIATATGNLGRHLINRHQEYEKGWGARLLSLVQLHSLSPVRPRNLDHKEKHSRGKVVSKLLQNFEPSVQLWLGEKYAAVFQEVFRSMCFLIFVECLSLRSEIYNSLVKFLKAYLEKARAHFMRNYYTSHYSSMSGGYSAQETEDGGSVSFAEEIARKKRRASMSNATDELTHYLSEPPAPIQKDVLEWWKVNSTRHPLLSVMVREFLAVQATSVMPEELFCSKGHGPKGGIELKSTGIDYDRLMELAAAMTAENSSTGFDKKQK
ncbi:hypothetical protein SLEP1_g8462 [Rubroshorea leprosula]|uniref:BED-type domain-containing protein n=1 Tax=Rubroshorea leprosula TaxID=152421 RepID=A0AAV5IBK7_9ROSI|nr:hypothetical protein SLEP1_g8462 [Rubroshorea leprosula]